MVIKQVNATLEERESKKGKNYLVLVVRLTDTYEKLVFLEQAENELLKLQVPNKSTSEIF